MNKYGLVLAGGGAKGMYQLGAWKAMRELGVEFSAVAGVSIGSINGALIASGCYDDAVKLWQNASVDKGINITEELRDAENLFSLKNFTALVKEIVRNGGIDASPTKELISQFIDEDKVRKSDIKFGMVTFHLSEFTPLQIFIDKIPEGQLIDYLLASSKVPGVSNIGPEGERFLDGGVYDNAPTGMLRKNGYNRLIVIDISSMKGFGHKNDMTCTEFIYIRPYDIDELGAAFDFSPEMQKKRFEMGYLDARKSFGYLLGNRYYFEADDFRKAVLQYGADTFEQLEELASGLELERLKIYSVNEFLIELKKEYEEFKHELTVHENDAEEKFYSRMLKKIPLFRSQNEYPDAVAILDDIIM